MNRNNKIIILFGFGLQLIFSMEYPNEFGKFFLNANLHALACNTKTK